MKLNFKVEYKQDPKNKVSSMEGSYNLISASVSLTHKDGLEGQMRRMYGRIQRKFDEAIDTEKDIELDDNELDFIKKSLKEAKFPPNLSYNVMLLEDYLEKDEKK